ncbi:hypothetical protein K493DRAFT_132080, partial [Basidiobolus meristosporus CBS 931.73]
RRRKRTVISCTECHRRKKKCDRLQPCNNCTTRGKQSLCLYESVQTTETWPKNPSNSDQSSEGAITSEEMYLNSRSEPQVISSLASTLGYSMHNSHNTLGIIRKISPSYLTAVVQSNLNDGLSQRYRELIRQLPSRNRIDMLVQRFFADVCWNYDVIDEMMFRQQLEAWGKVSYSTFQRGPLDLPVNIRVFPALLFQVLAQALLYAANGDEALEQLKYAPGMTFHDLAMEFSESGNMILTILGKRETTLATVQAGLLRASFLKSSSCVVEAWHVLGITIRDAQEIDLHSGKSSEDASSWDIEMRRRMWLALHLWDAHMAVVLGRPMSTNLQTYTFANDVLQRRDDAPPTKRVETDPPTPFTVILMGYNTAYRYLPKIHELESSGASPEDYYCTVSDIHTAILGNIRNLPDWCRLENPNLKFDKHPSCYWLPAARETLSSEIYFVLLALHRPYIFSVAQSRTEALRAALKILGAQARLFTQSDPRQYMAFNLVFSTFDAMVLTASIYILYPHENRDKLDASLRSIEWGMDRLNTMAQCNKMAKSAYNVVLALRHRLKQRLAT